MKKILIALALAAGLLVVPAPVAHAEDDACVYRRPYRQVEASILNGDPMSRWQVHQLFVTTGRVVYKDDDEETRVYRGCGEGSKAWVGYEFGADGIYRAAGTACTWTYFGDGLDTLHPA